MRKLLLVLVLLLSGCSKKTALHVDVYSLSTCGACNALQSELERYEKSHPELYLTYYDLDESDALKKYQKIVKTYKITKNKTPVIVVQDYFIKVGYQSGEQKSLEKALDLAIKGKTIKDKDYTSL